MLRTISLALLSVPLAGAVQAGNLDPVQPAPVVSSPAPQASPATDWSGGYVGAQLGYGYGDFSLDPGDFDDSSVIGGIHAGYLWGFGNGWYVGPELQYDRADLTVTDPGTGDTGSFEEMARLKLVLGRELGQNGLLYGSAGLAYGSVDGVDTFIDGSDGSYVLGLGYDHRLTEDWSVGVEYQYHDFDGIGAGGGDVAVNTVHLKAAYRF